MWAGADHAGGTGCPQQLSPQQAQLGLIRPSQERPRAEAGLLKGAPAVPNCAAFTVNTGLSSFLSPPLKGDCCFFSPHRQKQREQQFCNHRSLYL